MRSLPILSQRFFSVAAEFPKRYPVTQGDGTNIVGLIIITQEKLNVKCKLQFEASARKSEYKAEQVGYEENIKAQIKNNRA